MATRNVTPKGTGEGGLGTALLNWLNGYIRTLYTDHIEEINSAHGVVIDGITLKDGGALGITGGTNTFNIANGTASLDVAAGKTVNIDDDVTFTKGLTVTTNAGTLAFGAASKTLTIDNSIEIDGTSGTKVTFTPTLGKVLQGDGTNFVASYIPMQNILGNTDWIVASGSTLENARALPDSTSTRSGTTVSSDAHLLTAGKLVKAADATVLKVMTVDTNSFTVDREAGTDGQWYEVYSGYVAADTLAPDGGTKTATLDIYRVQQDATHTKGYYGIKYVKGADTAEYHNVKSITGADLEKYKGQVVAFGMAGYSTTATDNLKIQIYDGVSAVTESSFWGADAIDWQEIKHTVNAAATELTFRVLLDGDTGDVAYGSFHIAIPGSFIGEYNYAPKQGEKIWLQVPQESNLLHGKTGFSTTLPTALSLEADSNGVIGKSIKTLHASLGVNDSGSAAGAPYVQLRGNTSNGFINSIGGITNDAIRYITGEVGTNSSGDIEYEISASGSSTLDIQVCRYTAVELQ